MIGFIQKIFNPVRNKRAQIVIPAVLLVPTILLVIYLLFETTKLSREKIMHQFATDASAFVELTSTSNFLNATAYTNGAFPFRLFRENFDVTNKTIKLDTKVNPNPMQNEGDKSIFEFFYMAGAFPALGMDQITSVPKDTDITWEIRYFENTRPGWNTDSPPKPDETKFYPITSEEIAEYYNANWHLDSIKLYLFMYYLLSQIYENQKKVYERITSEGEFFRKGYYLNTGNCRLSECGREGAREFKKYFLETEPVYIQRVVTFYKDPVDGQKKSIKLDLKADNIFDGKLYQFAYLSKPSKERARKLYTGIEIKQSFEAPSNYFRVGLKRYNPHTHVRVAMQCTKESNNCVWPNPTPKYQVRIYP